MPIFEHWEPFVYVRPLSTLCLHLIGTICQLGTLNTFCQKCIGQRPAYSATAKTRPHRVLYFLVLYTTFILFQFPHKFKSWQRQFLTWVCPPRLNAWSWTATQSPQSNGPRVAPSSTATTPPTWSLRTQQRKTREPTLWRSVFMLQCYERKDKSYQQRWWFISC